MKRMFSAIVISSVLGVASSGHADPPYDKWEIISLSPVSGKPWVGKTSAFDWGSWSYSDSVLKNNAATTRTWVVPFPTVVQYSNFIDDQHGVWSMTTHLQFRANVRAGSDGDTCIQGVVNSASGSRYSVSGTSCTSSTSNTWLATSLLSSDTAQTAYLNINVGGGGGRVHYTQALAYMWTQ